MDSLRPIEVLFKNEDFYINVISGNQIRKEKEQEVKKWINENIEHLKKNNKPELAAKLNYDETKSILNNIISNRIIKDGAHFEENIRFKTDNNTLNEIIDLIEK